jgi:hypothetical protein
MEAESHEIKSRGSMGLSIIVSNNGFEVVSEL